MAYLKFADAQSVIGCDVIPNGDNIVSLKFYDAIIVDTSGFKLYLDDKREYLIGDYSRFKTIYRNDETTAKEGGYQLSNDGSTYVAPLPQITFIANGGGALSGDLEQRVEDYRDLVIPVPTADENYEFTKWEPEIPKSGKVTESHSYTAVFTYVQTLDEVKAAKITEMNAAQQEVIKHGVEVTLSDGTKERFTLKDQDQLSLMGLQVLAEQGNNRIPWHDADNAQHCKYYTAEDMKKITAAALTHISFNVTFYRDLRIYINAMTDKESVNAVTYGMYIPSEYQSEVLADFYAAQGNA